jgi:release factor glutamine methyltransferase
MSRNLLFADSDTLTIGEALLLGENLLRQAAVDEARFDAMLLLIFATKSSREAVIREPERVLTERERLVYLKALSLRELRRPVAYITGERWFYGRPFKINRAVLIPRPETELLVDFALTVAPKTVADIGTGSGNIAVSIAAELPQANVAAVDISTLALLLAKKNALRHGVSNRVEFFEGDLLSPVAGQRFDLIVSNPPYIIPADVPTLMPEVSRYEPELALSHGAGDDGMAVHRRLVEGARWLLNPSGWLGLEVGAGQAQAVCLFAEECGYKLVSGRPDLGGIDRIVIAQWK